MQESDRILAHHRDKPTVPGRCSGGKRPQGWQEGTDHRSLQHHELEEEKPSERTRVANLIKKIDEKKVKKQTVIEELYEMELRQRESYWIESGSESEEEGKRRRNKKIPNTML